MDHTGSRGPAIPDPDRTKPMWGTPEYSKWKRENTEAGRANYQRAMERQREQRRNNPAVVRGEPTEEQAARLAEKLDFPTEDDEWEHLPKTREGLQEHLNDLNSWADEVSRQRYEMAKSRYDPRKLSLPNRAPLDPVTQRLKNGYDTPVDDDAAEMLTEEHGLDWPKPLTTDQLYQRFWPMEESTRGHTEHPVKDVNEFRLSYVLHLAAAQSWEHEAATKKKPKPKPPRKPEEVWYDVHKHPDGVPGGMGKAPEYHLRNRGWVGHEIHGASFKTIQYRNPNHPDFVISFGGGTPQKPDHNFRIMYMGDNSNIPKITHAYQPAEAMNKVEELAKLDSGLIVLPMTHGAAATTPGAAPQPTQFGATPKPKRQKKPREMGTNDNAYPIGPPPVEFPTQPDREKDWSKNNGGVQEIQKPAEPAPTPEFKPAPVEKTVKQQKIKFYAAYLNDHGTTGGANRHRASGTELCPLCAKAGRIYRRDPDLYRELLKDSGGLTDDHLHTTSPFHDRIQESLTALPHGGPGRHPEGLGPADLGRTEYMRQWKSKRRALDDADVSRLALGYGMDISPEEAAQYPALRRIVSMAQLENWEEE